MAISLLSTKYHIPPVGENLVERRPLLQALNAGVAQGKRLILVCAPAGYGKTTLVAGWINQIARPGAEPASQGADGPARVRAAWLACDPDDNDLTSFLAYLVAALRTVDAALGSGLLATLQAAKPPAPGVLATLLINDLAQIPDRFVLALDDFHAITAQPIHDFLTYLIEHQPSQMCLVLVTRADPPLPVARLRGRGQMVEIRQHELAFNLEESADFLNQTMGVALTPAQVAALETRTEGWAAGLQLAALSLRSAPEAAAFIETFSGGHEYIADYLADEVLAQQPEAIQAFLLQTSLLERLSAPLCAALTGEPDAQHILETLREKNLFLVPLDNQKEWYRYHTLFSDLLRNRLQQTQSNRVNELHLRASHWYQENGLWMPAIEHAQAAGQAEQAALLIEQAVEPVFISGQVMTILRWLDALPAEVKTRHPILWIFHGLSLIWCGKSTAAVRPFLPELAPVFSEDGLSGETNTLQALYSMTDGNPQEAGRLAQSALQELPAGRPMFRCLAANTLGMASTLQCQTAEAIRAFELTIEIAAQAGFVMFEITASSHLAGLHLQQGRLQVAGASYRRTLDLAALRLGKCSPVTGNVLLGLGELAREWNDLDGALGYFQEALEMFAQFSEMGIPIAYLSIARVKASQGDWKSGEEYIEKARQAAQASKVTRMNDRLVENLQARFWIAGEEILRAEQWASQSGLLAHPISEIIQSGGATAAASEFVQTDYLNLARLYLAQNKVDAALQVLDPLLGAAEALGYMRRVIHLLVVKALALQQKQVGQAVTTLAQALALAEPEGYLRVFLDEGEAMLPLLYQVSERGLSPLLVKKILAAFDANAPLPTVPAEKKAPEDRLYEPLSEREREVLELIAAGLSNSQVALQLHISLSTVKGHTANIYGKLGVNSRTQALSEAARLRILVSKEK